MPESTLSYAAAEHRAAVAAAYRAWRSGWPWRWLPAGLRSRAYGQLGRGFTARYVAWWKTMNRCSDLEAGLALGSREVVVLTASQEAQLRAWLGAQKEAPTGLDLGWIPPAPPLPAGLPILSPPRRSAWFSS